MVDEEGIDKRRDVSPAIRSLEKYIPFLDNDDILRIGGRLEYASNPAILPYNHQVNKLFILDRHKAMAYRAADWVLASLSTDVRVRPVGGAKTVRLYFKDRFTSKLLHA